MFSKSTEYALRATIYIASEASVDKKASIVAIAKGIGAPKSFTAKILQHLTNKEKGFISSTPGPSGGFYITAEAMNKPIYSVIEAMGETGLIESCVLGLPQCSDEHPCAMHSTYKVIKMELLKMFREKSIQDVINSKDRMIPINYDLYK